MRVTRFLLVLGLVGVLSTNAFAQQRSSRDYRPQQTQTRAPQRTRADVAARPTREPQREGRPGEIVDEKVLNTIFSQVVVDGLENPTGIAVQPTTGDVFVAESGAGRVGRLHDVPGEYRLEPVVTGFAVETLGSERNGYRVGPLGLAFINKYTIAVGGGGKTYGQDTVDVYRVRNAGTVSADEPTYTLGPVTNDAGNYFGIAANESVLFTTFNGRQSGGGLARSTITDGTPGELEQIAIEGPADGYAAPTAIAIGRRGELVVAQMGSLDVPADSRISFFDSRNGRAYLDVPTGLNDVTGLAISPKTGRMYATDFSHIAPDEGGLYRIDLVKDAGEWICEPVRLMTLNAPSGLAFRDDGELMITTFKSHSSEHKGGLLIRIYNDSKL
ncbi:MAG: hypothetical protein R3C10_08800 [Pirellulales bacterium]|nr:hypothetical protein [Planctomycetales bacterium]